jgi:type 1 glutamine amidotransferase
VLQNGEHFADLGSTAAVPRSRLAGDFTRRGQLRYFAVNLNAKGQLSKVVLEAMDAEIVPATVALTVGAEPAAAASAGAQSAAQSAAAQSAAAPAPAAQAPAAQAPGAPGPKEGGKGDAPLPETRPITWAAGRTKVLVVAGGSSHDFGRHFGETDVATLRAAGFDVHYTEDRDQAAAELGNADVAVISVNRQHFDTPAWRAAVMEAAKAGKGLVMLHPGTWYAFPNWPELNATIVGGGSRGHDKLGPFSVTVVKPEHPVVRDVPRTFEVVDELYYVNAEPEKIPPGTAAIEVLAETSPSQRFMRPHPAVWITRHPAARVVGITLGHDERVHEHAAFKTLLVNAVRWAGGKAR